MVEIYSKSLVRAFCKVLHMKFSQVVRINDIGNNNGVLTDFYPCFSLYTLPHSSVGLTGCISNAFSVLNIFYSFDHYAAFWFPLT